ncbi:alpha-glucosidase [Schizosaccharomyces osmophilus]|uniref:Alpha-glucosidase n=1 Tax=Schizosaccharomyces osmophilus TaxID=2545709 RepID=A0AAE9WE93_9SCHI|nr:alpha-glucosidase [Schizosaccharomyces osmophilus]WBW74801.1 alpha-glucosidase [Schizosaccharomyces osmophilus]
MLPRSFFLSFFAFCLCISIPSFVFAQDASKPTSIISSSTTTYRVLPTPSVATLGIPQTPSDDQPYRGRNCPGYRALNVSESSNGVIATLALRGPACYAYGNDYSHLLLNVSYDTVDRIHVSISDLEGKQFRFTNRSDVWDAPLYHDLTHPSNRSYSFLYNADPFEFWVVRTTDGEVLFDTRGHSLIFQDQYIELTTNMVENYNLYGLAETVHGLRLGNNLTRTFWANGDPSPLDSNAYGTHPFYLEQRYSPERNDSSVNQTEYHSSSHGVLMLTANGMEVLLRPNYLQYRMIGGVVDLYIYVGGSDDPKKTVSQFVKSIGTPSMQQYWTLGFHISRWGYSNVSDILDVRKGFSDFQIPVDTFWNDIDYMYMYRDFTMDPISYSKGNMVDFFKTIESTHQHYVPMIDAAIYAANPNNRSDDSYYPYYKGIEDDIFIKNPNGSIYVGNVWPGYTVFPDFTNPASSTYWKDCLFNLTQDFGANSSELPTFTGLWIDMNEPTSFCVGSCGSGHLDENPVHVAFVLEGETNNVVYSYPEGFNITNVTEYSAIYMSSLSQYHATATSTMEKVKGSPTPLNSKPEHNFNNPPYALTIEQGNGDLANEGLSTNATYHDGTVRYNLFNIYGYGMAKATYDALASIYENKRPFILSRSTFLSSGRYAAHWLGDNYSLWSNMFFSIPGMLTFNMVGLPMVGADACGFMGNTDEDLCSRWMAMAAFSPFFRNHNSLGSISQEPYRWESVAESSRRAMSIRYSLLPYWYTLMKDAHSDGFPMLRALFLEFPNEQNLAAVDRQFMVGDALLITPVLEPNVSHVQGVFPGNNGTKWYDWYNHTVIERQYGENVTLYAPLEHINVAIRGGKIIPLQVPSLTTYETRQNPFNLLVALDSNEFSEGTIYIDDGESITQNSTLITELHCNSNKLSVSSVGDYHVQPPLANVTVLGLSQAPSRVLMQNTEIHTFTYVNATKELVITNLDNYTMNGAFSTNWTISW